MASRGAVVKEIAIERLGQLQTWKLRAEPHKAKSQQRTAYEAGFTQRTQDWSQGREGVRPAPHYRNGLLERAWEQGYHDALIQDSPL